MRCRRRNTESPPMGATPWQAPTILVGKLSSFRAVSQATSELAVVAGLGHSMSLRVTRSRLTYMTHQLLLGLYVEEASETGLPVFRQADSEKTTLCFYTRWCQCLKSETTTGTDVFTC